MEKKEREKEEAKKVAVAFSKKNKSPTPTIESCIQGKKPYEPGSPIYCSLMRKFVIFVATSSSPVSIVENKELRSFLNELNPRFSVPSRNTMDREMSKLLTELKRRISSSLQEGGKIALTIDIWSKKGMSESFLGVTGHCFLKKSLSSFHCTLAVKRFTHPHTAERVLQITRDVLRDWEIDVIRVSRIVTDNGSNMVAAFREDSQVILEEKEDENAEREEEEVIEEVIEQVIEEVMEEVIEEAPVDDDEIESAVDDTLVLEEIEAFDNAEIQHDSVFSSLNRLSCFSHTLQLVARQFDTCPSVKKILAKVFSLVKKFNKSSKATEKLITLKLLSHCPTRWSSTHIVVSRLLELRVYVTDICQEFEWNCLLNSDWKMLENYKALLDPFAHYTQLASSENCTSISSIIPIVLELGMHLKEIGEKPGMAVLSNMIVQELNRCFQRVYDTRSTYFDPIYVAATYLDPRYRLALSREQIIEAKRAIISFSKTDDSSESDDQFQNNSESQSLEPPKKKFKHLAVILARNRESLSQSLDKISKIEEEMCLYDNQNLDINEDIDPIVFWLSCSQSYPKLFDVVGDILSIPVSSAPVERVFSISGDACRGKRNRLSGKNLERETLLRMNRAILLD
uniref:HAT C-terminal dimerisation domain-containing protein n=1 Tax=Amphimedon queenslandica TaxID=400682 RepID=A0A1X7SXK3_AMPQE